MSWYDFIWNHGPGGNVEHIAEHGLTTDDVEAVICNPLELKISRSSGRPMATGYSEDGQLIVVVYEEMDAITVYPVIGVRNRAVGTMKGEHHHGP